MTISDFQGRLEEISKTRSNTSKGETADELISHIAESNLDDYRQYHSDLRDSGVNVITVLDPEYPQKLKSISDPPLCIYVDGNISTINNGITIVGTRSATEQRIESAQKIARAVVQDLDVSVISGLANGIDEAAHRGAIEASGKTVAVLPSDIEDIKPASNKRLGKEISGNGALLSETSCMTGFHKGRYLERNRITSGLSDAVVVVASKETGGTMKQAELAQAQGKPRFVYQSPQSDEQTPEILTQKKGYQVFSSVDELIHLISDSGAEDVDSQGNLTLGNF